MATRTGRSLASSSSCTRFTFARCLASFAMSKGARIFVVIAVSRSTGGAITKHEQRRRLRYTQE
jgi:hypothetical protein